MVDLFVPHSYRCERDPRRRSVQSLTADKLSAAGWSWGYCSAVTRDGWRWIVDAHREGGRYIAHSDELLSAMRGIELDAMYELKFCQEEPVRNNDRLLRTYTTPKLTEPCVFQFFAGNYMQCRSDLQNRSKSRYSSNYISLEYPP